MLITNFFPSKQVQNRNQSFNTSIFTKEENKTHNSSNDNNINTNCNVSYQKTLYLSNNESNYDLNSQTDGSTINNIREIKVNISGGQLKNPQKNYYYQKCFNNQPFNLFHSDEDKLKKIIFIQQWWKATYRIIFIQKYIRGFLCRKSLTSLYYFTKCLIKLLFKLIIRKLRYCIKNKNEYLRAGINSFHSINYNQKKNNNNPKIVKNKTISKIKNNNNKSNNANFYADTNSFLNKKIEDSKKITNKKIKLDYLNKQNNNKIIPNNNNKLNFQNSSNNFNTINSNTCKCFNKNRNRKYYKEKKEKEKEINNISNKDKLIAYNNIFNIYNNVKKYYENDSKINFGDGNYSTLNYFYPKKQKSPTGRNNANNNKLKSKKMVTRGSMKNINEKIIINKNNNINVNININNNPKTDRANIYQKSPDIKRKDSIYYLLKLKKLFLFWNEYSSKKKIVQKLKIFKNIKTPNNIKKSFSIYSIKNTKEQKSGITSKRINLSNSLINIKNNKVTPKKLNSIDNYVPKQNCIYTNYSKKPHGHSNSVENNSMLYFKTQEGFNSSTFAINPESNMQTHQNFYPNNICNNSVIIVSQYDRNTEVINNNNFINDMKEKEKIYYFFAVINLIDKHNRRRRIRKYFNKWKSLLRYGRTFINSKGIEEKIICFKSIKSPPKTNLEDTKLQQQNKLTQNNSSGNFNFQTEANHENYIRHYKANSIFSKNDLLTPNPLEKTIHPNFFKSNYRPQKIVYQKKFLAPKKMRNQSMHAININDIEDDRNMTIINNNRDLHAMNQITGNNFYNVNPFMINTNANTNTDYNNAEFMKRSNIENSMGKIQEGRMNRIKRIEETEINFSPFQINLKKNHNKEIKKDLYENNNNKININVEESYNKKDNVKDRIDNNINNNKSRITTKQIILGEKRKKYKNFSISQEHGKNTQNI